MDQFFSVSVIKLVYFLLQLSPNGYAYFGNHISPIRIITFPYSYQDGLTILVPYSMDMASGNLDDVFLSYR